MTTRDDAIAYLVDKLREIEAGSDQLNAKHNAATQDPGGMDFQAYTDHRDAADLHYAVAYRCEQLIEEITGNLLFDQLDQADAAAEMTNADVMSYEEMAEYDRDAEFAQDAADEARWAAEADDHHYDVADYGHEDDQDNDEDGEY